MVTSQTMLELFPEQLPNDILYSPRVTDDQIRVFIQKFREASIFALDIETYGEDVKKSKETKGYRGGLNYWKGEIRLIQIGLLSGGCLLADLGGWFCDRDGLRERLCRLGFFDTLAYQLFNPQVKVLGHNLKFDLCFLKVKFGYEAQAIRDTQIMSQVLWATPVRGWKHSLAAVYRRCFTDSLDKTHQRSDWSGQLLDSQIKYAAKDVQALFPLFKSLGYLLRESGQVDIATRECETVGVYVDMETNGFRIEVSKLNDAIAQFQVAMEGVLAPFTETFPGLSPTASGEVLLAQFREKLQLDLDNTQSETLLDYGRKYPELKALSYWRTLKNSLDYLIGLKKGVNERGRVVSSFKQLEPFGRSSSKSGDLEGVNLQNCPKPILAPEIAKYKLPSIRGVFAVEEDRSLIVADLSQAHQRIAVEASGDPFCIDIYNQGRDFHCITASTLAKQQGLDWDEYDIDRLRKLKTPEGKKAKGLRDIAKNVNYGSLNDQGWATLQTTCKNAGVYLSEDEAKEAIKAWRTTYKGLRNFQMKIARQANARQPHFLPRKHLAYGQAFGLSGRTAVLPKYVSDWKPDAPPAIAAKDVCAFYWQSTEADIIKEAGVKMRLEFLAHPEWDAHFCNCCHDEWDIECKREYEVEVATVVFNCIQDAMNKWITSIPVDEEGAKPEALIGRSWADK